MAIGLFNERGGVDGRMVQAVTADSQSKADVAINEAERLLGQEGLEVVTGIYSSAHAVPLAQRFEAARRIMWITSAISVAVLKDRNLRYVFRPTVHSDQYGAASVAFVHEHAQARLRSGCASPPSTRTGPTAPVSPRRSRPMPGRATCRWC
ncbi:ABC transporter substrate-binding protein [Crenalkalicoccus roseus]|uniref:ABC transporter substrate-binding protein n=1 Tax=Crenalkalicoccus roseus TaxID=1485588 RepID=UPI00195ED48E|nr:ABC transporter substrate-binding protein [Crenalkalicoccus roseus]